MVNGLMILIGESFRSGGQHTRERGNPDSVKEQIMACQSHIRFMKSFNDVKWNVRLFTYSTNYDSLLLNTYGSYIEKYNFIKGEPIGLNNLYKMSIERLPKYDFILVCRIDLYLKDMFISKFNYKWPEVRYPFVCWTLGGGNITHNHPRVSDTLVFIPKNINTNDILIEHEGWFRFIEKGYTIDNIDVMINTYHDSDSEKDYNPLYYIVNRSQTNNWSSRGQVFNKELYRYV
jgi:hypothetical protein